MGAAEDFPELPHAELHQWRIRQSGSFAVLDVGRRDLTPRGRKARAILAYLSAHPGTRIPRERLMELLWGDRGQPQARSSLRQSLSEIRRSAPGLMDADREHVWIETAVLSVVEEESDRDAALFDDLNHVTAEFDEWLATERVRRGVAQWEQLRTRVEHLIASCAGDAALPLIEQMRQIDPFNEQWLRLAMQAEFHTGHTAGIEQRFTEFTDSLREELGIAPAVETCALHDRLLKDLSAVVPDSPTAPELLAEKLPTPPSHRKRGRRRILAGIAGVTMALGLSQSVPTAATDSARSAGLPF